MKKGMIFFFRDRQSQEEKPKQMQEYKGKRLIIYGLGKAWEYRKGLIESQYQIVGYSDSRRIAIENFIEPDKISTVNYDYILISSTAFFN